MSFARLLLSAAFLAAVAAAVLAAALLLALVRREQADLPPLSPATDYRPAVASRLLASDGSVIGRFAEQDRTVVPLADVPPRVVQAFVSAEDQNFWKHQGVDPVAVARAAVTNLRHRGEGKRAIGASTITQQVVKNLVLGDEMSVRRKVREALLAVRLEREVGKRRVMEVYLNEIYLGRGAYGVAAAAAAYFGKPLGALSLADAAFLAALPKAPANYDPERRPEAARARRAYVLERMVEDGAASPAEAAAAAAEPLPVPQRVSAGGAADGYFSEEVRRRLVATLGQDAVYRGGILVRTSMDPRLQHAAETALRNGLEAYDRRHGWRGPIGRLPEGTGLAGAAWARALAGVDLPDGSGDWRAAAVLAAERDATLGFADGSSAKLTAAGLKWARKRLAADALGPVPSRADQVLRPGDVVLVGAGADGALELRQIPEVEGALVAVEAATGRMLAVAGGFSYERSKFNRATQGQRQPGSAFKPFVYLAALEGGMDPTSPVLDVPIAIDAGAGAPRWRPSNYGGDAGGLITVRQALEKSRNMATVRLLYDIGLEDVGKVSAKFGLYREIPNYAAALGAVELSPIRLTTAYAMLANGGWRVEPSVVDEILSADGGVVYRRPEASRAEADRVASPVAVAQMISMLEGVVRRGTAAAALREVDLPIAGKTGTTNEARDAWFVGFTPDIAVGVHVGFDTPRELGDKETGGRAAAPIFGEFVKAAAGARPPSARSFALPEGVRARRVDAVTGEESRSGVEEIVKDGGD